MDTVPGIDTVLLGHENTARLHYRIEEVVEAAGTAVYNFSAKSGAQVEVEPVVLDEAGKPTDTSHVCVKGFLEAIHETRGVESRP